MTNIYFSYTVIAYVKRGTLLALQNASCGMTAQRANETFLGHSYITLCNVCCHCVNFCRQWVRHWQQEILRIFLQPMHCSTEASGYVNTQVHGLSWSTEMSKRRKPTNFCH